MEKSLLFIYNPVSGKGKVEAHLKDIKQIFSDAGFEVTLYPTISKGDATKKVIAEANSYDRVVVSGGDGTLNEAIEGFLTAKPNSILGYIPAGSTNDFGNSLGLSKNIEISARIAAGDKIREIDVGRFNSNKFFSYTAAFGIITDVAYRTSQKYKRIFGRAAYVVRAGQNVLDIPAYKMRVEADGEVFEDEYIYGMITNSTNIGGMDFLIRGNVDLSDGLFELMLIKYPDNPINIIDMVSYLLHIKKRTNYVYSCQANKIKIICDKEVPWTIDGEDGGAHKELVIQNEKRSIKILVG